MSVSKNTLDISNIDEFRQVLFQMNPQQIKNVIDLVESMKPELEKRIHVLSEIQEFVEQRNMSFKALKLSSPTIKLK